MSDYLPAGLNENDIIGNRPIDHYFEAVWEGLADGLWEKYEHEQDPDFIEKIDTMIEKGWMDEESAEVVSMRINKKLTFNGD